jgi:mannitol-1-phosphate 5-dehydrogenase
MKEHVFVGFGFGPIQSGLFAKEAFESGNFRRIVIADIDACMVDAVRADKGTYYVNVANSDGIETLKIDGVEMLNPAVTQDRKILLDALAEATEIVTSLPSVKFYDNGTDTSVAALIAAGLKNSRAKATIVYTAENNNHAAEILQDLVHKRTGHINANRIQFLNTVIGKMSQVVMDADMIKKLSLKPMAATIERAFLVEAFNKILVTRTTINGFKPGIPVFIEKDNLLPYEEAKLYGHNAIHAILAYLGAVKGYAYMTELKNDPVLMKIARDAFLNESGEALIRKHKHLNDELFTSAGYKAYADDLLERMTNPYLRDTIERAGRDLIRKLGYDDRIFGTMAVALEQGIEPVNMAVGALAGIVILLKNARTNNIPNELHFDPAVLDGDKIKAVLDWLWGTKSGRYAEAMIAIIKNALPQLKLLLK